jgi:membrane-associated phospholipid phosphatase
VLQSAERTSRKSGPSYVDAILPKAAQDSAARPLSVQRLVVNVLQDQKHIWLFPVRLIRGQSWKPTLIFLWITGALLTLDPFDPSYFRHTNAFHMLNQVVSGHNATVAMWFVMLSALALGFMRHDEYLKGTFFFAFQAVLDSEILTQTLKGIDRRVRPQDVHHYQHLWDSWFQDKGTWYSGPGSFPSGHMIAAISIAAVFAIRYRHHRWAPWAAYTAAGIIGVSRITLLSHFPSDVFAGAFLGYVIVRYVVLRPPDAPTGRADKIPEDEEMARLGVLT